MPNDFSNPVPPNAVRVWRGWRQPGSTLSDFYAKLGTVFVPATVLMQIDAGLHSYTPTVPAGLPDKPDAVPDETAILFWEDQETYWNGFTTLAVRTYTLTHGGVYDGKVNVSRADLPTRYAGTITPDQPVYLFDTPADWMHGAVTHFVGARADGVDATAFQKAVAAQLTAIQKQVTLQGAIACVGQNYLVYWELGSATPGIATPPSGVPLLKSAIAGWSQVFTPAPTFTPIGLWETWSGMNVSAGSSFNMQFRRRAKPT